MSESDDDEVHMSGQEQSEKHPIIYDMIFYANYTSLISCRSITQTIVRAHQSLIHK